ncbi:MAG: DUF11 domain-containing protein [Thermoleophilia bacterium]|nr:DUF11 domain-containing protein [Thermoleophilia bacterium]
MSHPPRRIRRRALPLVAAGGVALLAVPAAANATSVQPTIECVVPDGSGNLVAYFGYDNPYSTTNVAVGSTQPHKNYFTPGPEDRGQPTRFLAGSHPNVFKTTFPESQSITWHLVNVTGLPEHTATASSSTKRCLPNLVLDITGPATGTPGQEGTWVVTVTHGGWPGSDIDQAIPVAKIETRLDGRGVLTPDASSVPADGMLKPGQKLTYTVKGPFTCVNGQMVQTATTGLTEGQETTLADNTDSTPTTVSGSCSVDLGIGITPSTPTAAPGDTVTWTVPVTNAGPTPVNVSDIRVIAPGLPGLTPAPGSPTTLAPGQSITYVATTPITPAQCGTITNVVRVGYGTDATPADQRDTNPANDVATGSVQVVCGPPVPTAPGGSGTGGGVNNPGGGGTQCVAPRLAAAVSGPRAVVAGQLTTVTLVARNRSPRTAAADTVLRYTVPAGFSLTAVPKGATLRRGILTVQVGKMAAGASRTVRLVLRVNRTATRDVSHRARVSAACRATATGALATQVNPIGGPLQPNVTG